MFRNCLVVFFYIYFLPFVVPVLAITSSPTKDLLPAGTVIYCTMDEPNFSSKTAVIGDPVLCSLGPVRSFGHSVFPRGAQLSGHLQDYKNPGHFVGKGSLSIEFDRIILPNAEVLPLSAKIVSVPHQRVDAHGSVHGKGHPKRDALLWAVPIFWPIKIISLPARGPYPTLKGESRLALRLLDDVEVPVPTPPVVANSVPAPPWATPRGRAMPTQGSVPTPTAAPVPQLASRADVGSKADVQSNDETPHRITILALQGGSAFLARDYWVDGGELHCIAQDGAERAMPLSSLDWPQTIEVNQGRRIDLSLHSKLFQEQ